MLNLSLKAGQKERFTFAVGKCVSIFSMAAASLDPSLPLPFLEGNLGIASRGSGGRVFKTLLLAGRIL